MTWVLLVAASCVQDEAERKNVRETLDKVLHSGEYDASGQEEKEEPPRERCGARPRVQLPAAVASVGHVVFYVIAGAAILALIAYVVRRLKGLRRKPKEEKESGGKAVPDEPNALLQVAEEEAARQRFVEAIRLCHRASLVGMDRRRVVRFQECLTSGDVRRQLAERPERRDFDSVASIFERAYFGKTAAGQGEYLECRRAAMALMEEGKE